MNSRFRRTVLTRDEPFYYLRLAAEEETLMSDSRDAKRRDLNKHD